MELQSGSVFVDTGLNMMGCNQNTCFSYPRKEAFVF